MIFNGTVLDGASAVQDITENRMLNGNVMNEPMTFTVVSMSLKSVKWPNQL